MLSSGLKPSYLTCILLLTRVLCTAQVPASAANPQEKPQASKPAEEKPAEAGNPFEAKTAGAQPEQPPDVKAYSTIAKITDPQKRLDALQKFVADFPKSSRVGMAENQILDTLIKSFPDQEERILTQAKKIIAAAPVKRGSSPVPGMAVGTRESVCNSIAAKLVEAGILLDQAEEFARQGISLLDEKQYIEEQKESFARMKKLAEEAAARRAATGKSAPPAASEMKEPTEEELAKRFQRIMASRTATLGQIYLKKGKFDEAAKILKKSYDTDPALIAATTGLAELAARDGNYEAAVNYYASAALTGRMSAAARKQFEAAYAKIHNGTLNGLEELLDARYRKEYPPPLTVERYKPAAARPNRLVLSEIFTGSGCPPCVAADLAFEAAMNRYSTSELAILMYHLHIPQPDPITNPSTQARAKLYKVNAVPSMYIDGVTDGRGGGTRENTKSVYERVNPMIEKQLEVPPAAQLKLEASQTGSSVLVRAKVDQVKSESKVLKLQIVLVEKEVRYTGENGNRFHPMVVRSLAGPDAGGFPVDAEKGTSVEYSFDLPKITAELKAHLDDYETNGRHGKITFRKKMHEIDPRDLAVVAFVQDESSKNVLQTAFVDLNTPVTASIR